MIRRVFLVLAVTAVAAGTAAASLSPQDYRKQANAICAKAEKSLNAIPNPKTVKELPGVVRSGIAVDRSFVKALAALSPPAALRSLHDKAVSLSRQELAGVEELLARIEDGEDPDTVIADLSPRIDPISKAEVATYRRLGLAACAKFAAS